LADFLNLYQFLAKVARSNKSVFSDERRAIAVDGFSFRAKNEQIPPSPKLQRDRSDRE
jgi:hypothetical protein